MDLSIIRDFLTCCGNVEQLKMMKIEKFRGTFPKITIFSLFKQLSLSSTPHINAFHMKKYLQQFSHNLQIIDPNQINNFATSKTFRSNKSISDDSVIDKGILLFLNCWGNTQKQFTFVEFANFFTQEQCSPEPAQEIPYHAKKKFFQIFETEIQGLLNIETLRQICIKEYKNIPDLFETLANKQKHQITLKSIKNLYLMFGQRMNEDFYEKIEKRLKLPLNLQQFADLFRKDQNEKNPKLQERKIYYSSVRRKHKEEEGDYFDEFSKYNEDEKISNLSNSQRSINFQTPRKQKDLQNRGITSTKLTKGEKIATHLKQSPATMGRFKSRQTPQRFYSNKASVTQEIQILGEILSLQQEFIRLKRNLCLRRDMDLELAYERVGEKFSELLNELYGCCNFTSFVRFIIPKDFEHRYLGFVRHEMNNKLTEETLMLFDQLLEAYDRKEHQIRQLWSKIDREMMFRMYCRPGDEGFNIFELEKYFSERQCKVLIQRMDPLGLGVIEYERFW